VTTMGKFFVPSTARTPADRVREALDQAELLGSRLRGAGPQVLELLHLLDQGVTALAELEAAGMDVRAERVRFETVQRQLRRRQGLFLAETGVAFQEERAVVRPDRARWWWFLDEAVARQRVRRLRRWLLGILVTALLLSAEFEAAAALTPGDPEPWIWQGVIHAELGEPDDARVAFETARSLYETDFDFLLGRSRTYLRVGDLPAASADIEQAIVENPDSGQGYLLRAGIVTEQGDYAAAIADLERAAELAQAAGDTQLEAVARTQRAMVIQLQMYQLGTPSP